MAIHLNPMPREELYLISLTGFVSGKELLPTLEALWLQDDFRPSYNQIWDCRGIDELDMDLPDLTALVKLLRTFVPPEACEPGKIAVVTARFVDYTFARALFGLTKSCRHPRKVFHSTVEAEVWLSIAKESARTES
ncbi:MAG: hypothetical protein R2834_22865 [Rhodothermales bacterium]